MTIVTNTSNTFEPENQKKKILKPLIQIEQTDVCS